MIAETWTAAWALGAGANIADPNQLIYSSGRFWRS